MKNYIKNFMLLFVLILSVSLFVDRVDAATLSSVSSGFHYMRYDSGHGNYGTEFINYYTIEDRIAYCIEPGVYEGTTGYRPATWEETGLPSTIKNRVSLIAYYGYTYPGHQTERYRMATQALIWETVMGGDSWIKISTDAWFNGTPIDVTQERQEIERLVANHYTAPSFAGKDFEVILGKTITLHDDNAVLENYDILVGDADYTINGSDLIITPKRSGNISIKMMKKKLYASDCEVFVADGAQNVMSVGNIDTVEADAALEVKEIKNFVSILKQYSSNSGTSTLLNSEPRIIFEIYDEHEQKYSEITTDENGYATIELTYGIWRFHQVNTTPGFEKIADFYVTVNETSLKEQYYNILDSSLSAYLQVLKIDAETGHRIAAANTTFKIWNVDTDQYVTQYVGGKVYDEFKTDEEGKFISYLRLPMGHYRLYEITSPIGYIRDDEGFEFTIDEKSQMENTEYGLLITVEYPNTPIKGRVEIYKTGEQLITSDGGFAYKDVPLRNVKFGIYASDDIYCSDGQHLLFHAKELVEILSTDESGRALSKELPLGKYYLLELATDEYHVVDATPHHFVLAASGDKTRIVYTTYTKSNRLKKGALEFTKTDKTSGVPIAEVIIEVYKDTGELIFKGSTDEKGKIYLRDLPLGKYYIKELEAAEGYVLDATPIDFEIEEDGQAIDIEMTNETIDVPKTWKDESMTLNVMGLFFLIGGSSYLIYEKKK